MRNNVIPVLIYIKYVLQLVYQINKNNWETEQVSLNLLALNGENRQSLLYNLFSFWFLTK